VSILTSTQPFANGVSDNGQVLTPGAVTLAEVLKKRGYATGAFVGGFVLDRRFGLDQGFDHYESPFQPSAQRDAEAEDLKRLGGEVVAAATQWTEKNSARPFFLFLHLFDLHTPDNLPSQIRKRFPGPRYTAELGYVDELLGQFFTFLWKQGLYDKALIVFTSDHGEGLGDHGENSHGFFIYQSTLAVPLIFHWPAGSTGFAARADEPVSLLGIAPTILEIANTPAPPSFQGKSLAPIARGAKSASLEEVYATSFYGRNHFNTSALWSMRKGRYKYIHAPRPEFYDLQNDPKEQKNLWTSNRTSLAQAYADRVVLIRRQHGTSQSRSSDPSPEVFASLRSLGYLAGSSAPKGSPEPGTDPKDRIGDYETYRRAVTLSGTNRLPEANRLLQEVLGRDGSLAEARILLALNLQRAGQHREAAKLLETVVQTAPANVAAHYYLAISYVQLKNHDAATKELRAALATAADRTREWKAITIPAGELLARLLLERKEYGQAKSQYEQLLKLDEGNYEAHYNLAWIDAREQRLSDAVRHLQAAVKARPDDAAARNSLGGLYLRTSKLNEAEAELTEATRLDPKSPWAYFNLGLVSRTRGDNPRAMEFFRRALTAQPDFRPAQEALAAVQKKNQ
jgi:tetratricopeptide (TPR) repeat protein